jgi:hypothetical protein
VKQSEHDIQSMLFLWSKYQSKKFPGILMMFAIPNGGYRHIATASKLKMEGVKAGVPDIFLPVARGGFHGLFLEVKSKGGRATNDQNTWLQALAINGYKCRMVKGFDEAVAAIDEYYSLVIP